MSNRKENGQKEWRKKRSCGKIKGNFRRQIMKSRTSKVGPRSCFRLLEVMWDLGVPPLRGIRIMLMSYFVCGWRHPRAGDISTGKEELRGSRRIQ